jgi:hypothetical protein
MTFLGEVVVWALIIWFWVKLSFEIWQGQLIGFLKISQITLSGQMVNWVKLSGSRLRSSKSWCSERLNNSGEPVPLRRGHWSSPRVCSKYLLLRRSRCTKAPDNWKFCLFSWPYKTLPPKAGRRESSRLHDDPFIVKFELVSLQWTIPMFTVTHTITQKKLKSVDNHKSY